jgi:hypothetical protein
MSFTSRMSIFDADTGLKLLRLVELPPREGQNGKLDEHRWRATVADGGGEPEDVELVCSGSAYHTGEMSTEEWIMERLEHWPSDNWDERSRLRQIRSAAPIRLLSAD